MTFTISMMTQMCLLVAVFILASVIGRDIDNKREEYQGDFFNEVLHNVRRQEDTDTRTTQCSVNAPTTTAPPNDNDVISYYAIIYSTNSSVVCSGGILAERLIISTASCVRAFTDPPFVVVGYNHTLTGVQLFTVHEIYIPRNFTPNGPNEFDLALMILKRDHNGRGIQFNDRAKSLCVTGFACLLGSNPIFTMVGITRVNGTAPPATPYTLTPVPNQRCSDLGIVMKTTMLCVIRAPSNYGCDGFLGSPAFRRYGGTFLMWGIVSGCLDNNIVVLTFVPNNLTCSTAAPA